MLELGTRGVRGGRRELGSEVRVGEDRLGGWKAGRRIRVEGKIGDIVEGRMGVGNRVEGQKR